MKKIIVAETPHGCLVWCDMLGRERTTTRPTADHYAREDDSPEGGGLGAQYPQICTEGERTGNTIVYAAIESEIPNEFATDLHGQLLPYEKYCKERDRRAAQEAEDAKLSTSNLQD